MLYLFSFSFIKNFFVNAVSLSCYLKLSPRVFLEFFMNSYLISASCFIQTCFSKKCVVIFHFIFTFFRRFTLQHSRFSRGPPVKKYIQA